MRSEIASGGKSPFTKKSPVCCRHHHQHHHHLRCRQDVRQHRRVLLPVQGERGVRLPDGEDAGALQRGAGGRAPMPGVVRRMVPVLWVGGIWRGGLGCGAAGSRLGGDWAVLPKLPGPLPGRGAEDERGGEGRETG